jgi:hypothetical protein
LPLLGIHKVSQNKDYTIQKRIIQNLYSNPVVVCDVSGKNANVMFELGMRLAFDKPTIIVKDDKTSYSFDTAPIEHLEYPRDLRFSKIVEFQQKLADKISGTYKAALNNGEYTTFLKHFGTFTVPSLQTKEVSKEDYILEELKTLKSLVINRPQPKTAAGVSAKSRRQDLCIRQTSEEVANRIVTAIREAGLMAAPELVRKTKDHYHISLRQVTDEMKPKILELASAIQPTSRFL